MKLNKALLVLAAAGFLPGFAAHAAPVEATATLAVTASTDFQHQLTASNNIVAGKLPDDTVLATGLVSGQQNLTKVSLAWNRAVNPKASTLGTEYGALIRVGSPTGDNSVMAVVKLEPVTQAKAHDNGMDKITYTLTSPAPSFSYHIVAANKAAGVSTEIQSGSYKMAVSAEAFFA
ncbi:hypothetical protein CF471_18415 [Salmonella enterica]|nr:hypothetical protein [Salmonella enterica]ECJ3906568.1 hypothetical protein [Salmonella enterica subsp. enterica serovar Poona]EDU8777383.1 hypothetical protein [Salmonella enterica subsp. enterica serovar Poona]EJO2225684.1 hypothetical protein [Salmonella enterica]